MHTAHTCVLILQLQGAVCLNALLNPALPSQLCPCVFPRRATRCYSQLCTVCTELTLVCGSFKEQSALIHFSIQLPLTQSASSVHLPQSHAVAPPLHPTQQKQWGFIYVCIMPNHLHIWLSFSSIWVVVPGRPEKGEMDFRMHRHPSLCPLSHLWSTYTTVCSVPHLRLFPTPVHLCTVQYVM